MSACPACGHENERGARFCSECGIALAGRQRDARAERKVVTVVFVDLVGFTAQSEQLDPEDVQALLAPYHVRLRTELERFGGTVEKFIGDAVMALFGAPVAHEDDPERAVRAALAIRDWIAEEGRLQVRIGVNTGEAIVNLGARPESGEGMAAGDIVNTAARIQAAARVNGILVGEITHRATAQTIDYGKQTTVAAKGKDAPVSVWEVVQARSRFGVDVTPKALTELVGRERELDQLKGALARARDQRSLELVTLVGVPGIGKSRLVAELFRVVDSDELGPELVYWRQGRSLPYGNGVSYWALAEMVKAHAGILETDSADDAEVKLTRALDGSLDTDLEWVRSHLRPLVGQASVAGGGSRDEAFAAWRRFFESLAEQRPLVLVFEDVHWADDGLLDFIDHLVDWVRDVPVLVLCTARLELLERRPTWGGGKLNAATVALAPLTDKETAVLIAGLSERPLLPAETQAALLARAGGNPLYAEQYVRMLVEREEAEELPLPETVQGIVAARLDALQVEEKALLQDAAVIGKFFWLSSLAAVGSGADDLEGRLHALERKEFVQRARRTSVEGEAEFAFKHVLVRDVAYGQIPRGERAEKHRLAAEWVESLGRPEDHAEMVAHHYVNALELARAAGQNVDAVSTKACVALREAGDRAASLSALSQAERYYADALALASEDDRDRFDLLFRQGRVKYFRANGGTEELEEARAGLLRLRDREAAAEAALMLADIAWHRGGRDSMVEHLEDARSLVVGTPRSRAQAMVLSDVSRYEMLAERGESAVEAGREALKLADELGLDDLRAHALNNIGSARASSGDRRGLVDLEESIALAARSNSIADLIRGYNNLTAHQMLWGELEEARASADETRRLGEHYGHVGMVRFHDGGAAVNTPYLLGDWAEALARADAFLAGVEQGTSHYQEAFCSSCRALIRLGNEDVDGAVADVERALVLARPIRDPQQLRTSLARSAFVFVSIEDERRARELLDEALAELSGTSHMGFGGIDFHLLAWTAVILGREADALAAIDRESFQTPWLQAASAVISGEPERAAEIMGGIGVATYEALYRLQAAEQLVRQGRRRQADVQLASALEFYRSVAAARYIREAEALLAATA